MKSTRILAASLLALLLAACGGGGGSDDSTSSQADPQWDTRAMDFGTTSVGSTTVRTAGLTNLSDEALDFSKFSNLPAGVTASGCASVAPGKKCTVTFTYKPTEVGSNSQLMSPVGDFPDSTLVVRVRSVEAALQAVSLYIEGQTTRWHGALPIAGPNGLQLTVKEIRVDNDASCSISLDGVYLTEFAGKVFQVGPMVFVVPPQGELSTAGNVSTTTFTQPAGQGTCYLITRPDPGYADVSLII